MFASKGAAFASRVLDRFRELGLVTDEEIARAGGPSSTTMTKFRAAAANGGDLQLPRGDTRKRIEMAAKWRAGSALALWEGREPTPVAMQDDPGYPTVGQIKGDAGDTDSLARRLDELEERLARTNRRADIRFPLDDGRTLLIDVAMLEADGREGAIILDPAWAERVLVAAYEELLRHPPKSQPLDDQADQSQDLGLAARRGRSTGQQLRRAQDEAGEAGDNDNGPEGSA